MQPKGSVSVQLIEYKMLWFGDIWLSVLQYEFWNSLGFLLLNFQIRIEFHVNDKSPWICGFLFQFVAM